MLIFVGSRSFLHEVSSLAFVNMASSDSCLIHFDGKKGPLTSFSVVSYKNFLDCHRIYLTLDGEECNVAQRSSQFVSDSMEGCTVENIDANFSYHRVCSGRVEALPAMHCNSLIFTIVIFTMLAGKVVDIYFATKSSYF
jgi:hypothetical protein